MPLCTKTTGCVFSVPSDEIGPCPTCAGFKVVVDPGGTAVSPKPPKSCAPCLGTGSVKLVDNKNATHIGPCLQVSDCCCDKTPAVWATLAEQFHFCSVHNRRVSPDPAIRAREAAAVAAGIAQKTADDATYQAKIDAAVAAQRWVDVPEPRRTQEMVKAGVLTAAQPTGVQE